LRAPSRIAQQVVFSRDTGIGIVCPVSDYISMFFVGTNKAFLVKSTPLYDHSNGPLQILFEIRIIKL
jgi:hypothetical protein